MYFEINVALNGKHLFATHKRSLTNSDDTKKVLTLFRSKFPPSEGYSINVSIHPEISSSVNINEHCDVEDLIEGLLDNV
jgi:hypothetical protein